MTPTTLRAAVLLGLFLAIPVPAAAKALPFVAARQLAAWCAADGAEGKTLCSGYVLAVADVLGADLLLDGRRACLPVGVRGAILVEAVRVHLAAHPERGFDRASVVAADALAKAYPCS